MSTVRPRLGFLGLGWIGRSRLEAVLRHGQAEIAILCEPDAKCLEAARDLAPQAAAVDSLDALLEAPVDGIVIATPSALHAGQARTALDRGFAVFCQKPLARNGAEVKSVIESARRADRLLSVDLSYRHLSGLQLARRLVSSGELGTVFAAALKFHNAYGPDKAWFYDKRLSGGGCVMDLGIHLVDCAAWIFGPQAGMEFARIYAGGAPLGDDEIICEDFATMNLRFNEQVSVSIDCSWKLHAGLDAVIEFGFYGTHGGLLVQNINGSFREFATWRFHGTGSKLVSDAPEEWQAGAICAWVEKLAVEGGRFDPEIELQSKVSELLDQSYAWADRSR